MSLSKRIRANAINDSDWLDKAKKRKTNESWLSISFRIAMKILKFLRENGMTQKELAEKLDFSPQYLSKVLKGKENLTIETITKIQNVIDVTLIQVPDFTLEETYLEMPVTQKSLQLQIKKPVQVYAEEFVVADLKDVEEVTVSNNQYAMAS